jgi:lipopolysaccharide transport system permease protein
MDKGQGTWDRIIAPKGSLLDLRLGELWAYRYLIKMFVRRDFAAAYKQTILGPLWFFIPPLLSSLTFTVIFGRIANLSTAGQPQFLFYMSGVLIWGYFAGALTGNASIFGTQSGLFSKVYFPRLVVPLANLVSGLLSFALQLVIFLGFLIYFAAKDPAVQPNAAALLLPVLVLISGLLGLGVGIIASALTTRYRDLAFLLNFGLSLWMYITPVIYPLSSVPEKYQWLMLLNPMAPVITIFRHGFLGTDGLSMMWLLYSAGVAFVVLLAGAVIFNRIERFAMDTI